MAKLINDSTLALLRAYRDKGLHFAFSQLQHLCDLYTLEELRRDMPQALINWQALVVETWCATPPTMFLDPNCGWIDAWEAMDLDRFGLDTDRWDDIHDALRALGRV